MHKGCPEISQTSCHLCGCYCPCSSPPPHRTLKEVQGKASDLREIMMESGESNYDIDNESMESSSEKCGLGWVGNASGGHGEW
jgi:hypothetical protein